MNKIEKISLHSALKPSKPSINCCFYPLIFDKYITFDLSPSIQSKYYQHWQDVVDIIKPFLDNSGIKILRIGSNKGYDVDGVNDYTLKTFNQNAYILSKSMLHFNSYNVFSLLASNLDTPLVCLFSGREPASSFPNQSSKSVLIDSPKQGMNPSFSDVESPKTIDFIDPIEVSVSILDSLEINHDLSEKKKVFGGHMSHIKTIEIVPDFSPSPDLLKNSLINVRADLHFNDNNIFALCQGRTVGLITKQALSEGLIYSIRNSVQRVSINADDSIDESFLKNLKKFNVNYEIFVTDKSKLYDLRLKYIDEPIDFLEIKEKPLDFIEESGHTLLVKSSKILISKNGSFPTKAHWVIGENSKAGFNSYIDTSDFWEDSDFINIYSDGKKQK